MVKSLDDLLRFLLEEIALCGEQGMHLIGLATDLGSMFNCGACATDRISRKMAVNMFEFVSSPWWRGIVLNDLMNELDDAVILVEIPRQAGSVPRSSLVMPDYFALLEHQFRSPG